MRAEFTIAFDASDAVRDTLRRIGRTEDASFSPDNRRLALVCPDRNSIAIADVEITAPPDAPHVTVTAVAEQSSPSLKTPHGVDFVDDETILVANRYGRMLAFRVPPNGLGAGAEFTPIEPPVQRRFGQLGGPGSVRIVRNATGPFEALVCDNRRSTVTRHELLTDPLCVESNEILLRRLLDFPDSVAVTDDRRWIAISNHDAHVVLLYRWTPSLCETSDPDCILRGTMYPHGLRFSSDGGHLIVADAGRPHINIYGCDGDAWRGVRYPQSSVRVMSDDVYARGRDAESRGPKGIGIDNLGRVLIVTYEKQPIAFFDLAPMIACSNHGEPDDAVQLGYEVEALEEGRTRLEERTATLLRSTSFRITKPLRVLNAGISKKRR